jgi:hypothetical protein
MRSKPSYVDFDPSTYAWSPDIDYRQHPECYRIGRGQQGVLTCEPYKSEIGRYWRFKTPTIALESAEKIYSMFLSYVKIGDFVGADMAKKYLHMGFTRARRYANHASGRKWAKVEPSRGGNAEAVWKVLPREKDSRTNEKAKSAEIFYAFWKLARENSDYLAMRSAHKEKYENGLQLFKRRAGNR